MAKSFTRLVGALVVMFALGAPSFPASGVLAQGPLARDRTYLNEMGMTLEGVRRLLLWVETHLGDADFARYAHPLAERYVEVSSHLTPSKKLAGAHPHLLLIVENVERAVDSAARGDMAAFRQRTRTVREELAILEAMLKQLKLKLPELMR